MRRSPTVRHGAPAAKPLGAEGLGAPEAFGVFDAPASVEADAELVGVGVAPSSGEEVALKGVQPPTMSARPINSARTLLAIEAKHYTANQLVAGRGGPSPETAPPPPDGGGGVIGTVRGI